MSIEKTLIEIFEDPDHNLSVKFPHHLELYEQFFEPFRGRDITIVEIGVSTGGSLEAWRRYFGPGAKIYGVDISEGAVNSAGAKIFTGDQGNREFLTKMRDEIGKIDILIDDGSHVPLDQAAAFDVLFDIISPGGLYIVEDLHYAYQEIFQGYTFVERLTEEIDKMNQFHTNLSFYFFPFLAIVKKDYHNLTSPVRYGRET